MKLRWAPRVVGGRHSAHLSFAGVGLVWTCGLLGEPRVNRSAAGVDLRWTCRLLRRGLGWTYGLLGLALGGPMDLLVGGTGLGRCQGGRWVSPAVAGANPGWTYCLPGWTLPWVGPVVAGRAVRRSARCWDCLLYTADAADERRRVHPGRCQYTTNNNTTYKFLVTATELSRSYYIPLSAEYQHV